MKKQFCKSGKINNILLLVFFAVFFLVCLYLLIGKLNWKKVYQKDIVQKNAPKIIQKNQNDLPQDEAKRSEVKNYDLVKINYGPAEKNKVIFLLPRSNQADKIVKLAYVVHGGGFVGGNSESSATRVLAEFYLSHSYVVASIDYRTCPDVSWPEPVTDIANGMIEARKYLELQGYRITETVYAGHSAGANAGALILYSKKYKGVSNVDKFVGTSGVYSPNSLTRAADKTISACKLNPEVDFTYDKKSMITAFLVESIYDSFDAHPMTEDSHLEFMAARLKGLGVEVSKYWLKKNKKCGHNCPLILLKENDKEFVQNLEKFLD